MTCATCGAPLAEGVPSCASCGQPAVDEKRPNRVPLLVGVGVGVLAVAVLAALVVPGLLGGDGDGDGSRLVELGGARWSEVPSGQVEKPERGWSVSAGGEEIGSSAVGSDRFFVIEGDGGSAALVARALSDGKEAWRDDLPGTGRLHLYGDTLVAQMTNDGDEGDELRSYDQGSGKLLWEATTEPYADELFFFDDRIIARGDTGLTAYRVDDGTEAWSEETLSRAFAVSGDRLFLGDLEEVRALSLATGDEIWSSEAPAVAALAVSGDRVLVGSEDVRAFRADDGEELWTADLDIGVVVTLNAVNRSTVVAVGYDRAVALDPSGKPLGDEAFAVDAEAWRRGFAQRLPGGNILLTSQEDLSVQVLDGDDGDRIGELDWLGGVSRSMIYAVDADDEDRLSAHAADDLERAWSVEVAGMDRVLVGDGLLVVQTDDGYELWT